MAYNNAIPQPNDQLSQSQPQLLDNFQAIKTLVDVNHETFNGVNQGKHKFVTLTNQTGSTPVFTGTDIGIWSEVMPITALPEVWFANSNGNIYAGTGSILSTDPARASQTFGWTMLPSGILVKWGRTQLTVVSPLNINLNAVGGPNFGAVFIPIATQEANSINLAASLQTAPFAFTLRLVYTLPGNNFVNWAVIGRQ